MPEINLACGTAGMLDPATKELSVAKSGAAMSAAVVVLSMNGAWPAASLYMTVAGIAPTKAIRSRKERSPPVIALHMGEMIGMLIGASSMIRSSLIMSFMISMSLTIIFRADLRIKSDTMPRIFLIASIGVIEEI
jgi:hypothetical protein